MSLAAGHRLGPYEVLSALGAGGMGEVYRARDTRLARDVAIKVLPDLFARDPERMARFEREAQLLASLNHPHIASVYGVEETPGGRALVMELVDGPTLADRIAQGPMAVDDAIPLAVQIAGALEAAHERGIIHRDLKPANVKLTTTGDVKVLDFGLAKAVEPAMAGGDLAHSPTMSVGTQAGMILGTAAYMSPEQARGRLSDRRTDVWAFGCVLFEMLAGRQAFGGESVTDLIAAIVKEEPDWSALPPDVPASIRRLLRRCLRKDPKQRLHDIGDARLELEDAATEPAPRAAAVRSRTPQRVLVAVGALAALLALATAWLAWQVSRPGPTSPVVRFSVGSPAGMVIGPPSWPAAVMSPDGTRLAVTASRGGSDTDLYIRSLDATALTLLEGTKGAYNPFFSPDGQWVAFTAGNKLKKIPREGGSAITIADGVDWGGGTWGADDSIIYTPNYSSGLWRVKATGGTPEKLTTPDPKVELGHWWPQLLPDGKHVIYTSFSTPIERSRVMLHSLDTGQARVLVASAAFARYVSSGHLLYLRSQSVAAVPFDAGSQQVTGAEVPMLDDVSTYFTNGVAQVSVSSNGTLAYVPTAAFSPNTELVWLERGGKLSEALPLRRRFSDPRLSPDGKRLAVTIEDEQRDVWTYDLDRGVLGRVSVGAASEFSPVWLADGRAVVYASERPTFQIFKKAPHGSAPEEPLVTHDYDSVPNSISPDGRFLVYTQWSPETHIDLWLLPLTGDRTPKKLIGDRFTEEVADVSPDGRWIAYTSNESGRVEVYVQAFPDVADRWQISTDGGMAPRWTRDGRRLLFATGAPERLMAVDIAPGPQFSASKPSVVFAGTFSGYDAAPDGRVLLVRRDPQAPLPVVNVVLNWFEELKKKSPR